MAERVDHVQSPENHATAAAGGISEEQRAELNAELIALRHLRDTVSAVAESLRGGYADNSDAAFYMRQIESALAATPKAVEIDESKLAEILRSYLPLGVDPALDSTAKAQAHAVAEWFRAEGR